MKIISMKQLREEFGPIKEALESGESFLLMYRSRPLAKITPADDELQLSELSSKKKKSDQPSTSPPPIPVINFEKKKDISKFNLKNVLSPKS